MAENSVSNESKVVEKTAPANLKSSQLPPKGTVDITDVQDLTPAPVRGEFGIGTKGKAAAGQRAAVTPSTNAVAYMFINSDFTSDNKLVVSGDKIVAAACNVSVENRNNGWTEYLCISPRTSEITIPSTTGGIATLRRTSFSKITEIPDNITGFSGGLREITPTVSGSNVGVTALLTEIPLTLLSPKGDSVDQYVSRVYNFSSPVAAPQFSKPNLSNPMQSLEIDKVVGMTPNGELIANVSSNQNTGGRSDSFIAIVPRDRTPGQNFNLTSLQRLEPEGYYFKAVATATDGTIVAEKIKKEQTISVESSYVVLTRGSNGQYSLTGEIKPPGIPEISQLVPSPENFLINVPNASINNVERKTDGTLVLGGSVSFRIADKASNIREVNVTALGFVTKQDSSGEFKSELLQPFKMNDTVKGKSVELTFYPYSANVTPEGVAYGAARVGDATKVVNYFDNRYGQEESYIQDPISKKAVPLAEALKVAPNFNVVRYESSSNSGNAPLFKIETLTFDPAKANSDFQVFGSGTAKFEEYSYADRNFWVKVPRGDLYNAAGELAKQN